MLFKKNYTYKNKDGKEVTGTRFYAQCGDMLIPIEPTYFKQKDENGEDIPDKNYVARKTVLSSYAKVLPDKD